MVWYCLVLTTTSQFSICRNHLSIITISWIESPKIVPKHSNNPVTGSSQYILQATMVDIPSIHPIFLSVRATPLQELHFNSKHTAKLTSKGQVESKIIPTVASLKTIQGNFKFFKEIVSPSSENIQLLQSDPQNSFIMIDIFLLRSLGYNNVGFFQRNPKEPEELEDIDIIQNLRSKVVGYYDSTLLLLSMDQRGSILLKSWSQLIFIASAIEIRLDFLIIDSLLGTLNILILPLPFQASFETSLRAGIYSKELLGELFTISLELEFDIDIEFFDLVTDNPIQACDQSKTTCSAAAIWGCMMADFSRRYTFLCSSCYDNEFNPHSWMVEQVRWNSGTWLLNSIPQRREICRLELVYLRDYYCGYWVWQEVLSPKEGVYSLCIAIFFYIQFVIWPYKYERIIIRFRKRIKKSLSKKTEKYFYV